MGHIPFKQVLTRIGRSVAYYPSIALVLGDVKTAVFLCQFLYWEGKQDDPDGWIYKRQSDLTNETGLSRYEQEGARKQLKGLGMLEEQRRGVPARLYYRFDWEKFDEMMSASIKKNEKKIVKVIPLTKALVKEQEDPLLYRMKVAFDELHAKHYEIAYTWSKDTKGGKDWKHLKLIAGYLSERALAIKRKTDTTADKVSDDEIANNFMMMLSRLRKFHIEKWLSPPLLSSNFNQIIMDLQNDKSPSGNSATPGSRFGASGSSAV